MYKVFSAIMVFAAIIAVSSINILQVIDPASTSAAILTASFAGGVYTVLAMILLTIMCIVRSNSDY